MDFNYLSVFLLSQLTSAALLILGSWDNAGHLLFDMTATFCFNLLI